VEKNDESKAKMPRVWQKSKIDTLWNYLSELQLQEAEYNTFSLVL